uniref:Putative secreted protein n=1 Tax=Anopheles marajoara TaxID=58244 RepID=A0A2M4CBQ6_9DIPT
MPLLLLLVVLEAAIEASSVMLTYVGCSCGCSLVICAGIGEGHWRGMLELAFLTDVVESGRSRDEQRTGSGGRHATLAGDLG